MAAWAYGGVGLNCIISAGNEAVTAGLYAQDEWTITPQLTLNYGAARVAAAADALEHAARDGDGLEGPLDAVQAAWPPTLEAVQLRLRDHAPAHRSRSPA